MVTHADKVDQKTPSNLARFQTAPLKPRGAQRGTQQSSQPGKTAQAKAGTVVDADVDVPDGSGKHGRAPETHERGGTHELIRVQARFLLPIGEKNLDAPAYADLRPQACNRSLLVAGSPRPCELERLGKRMMT